VKIFISVPLPSCAVFALGPTTVPLLLNAAESVAPLAEKIGWVLAGMMTPYGRMQLMARARDNP
jgi:hypothetical protein